VYVVKLDQQHQPPQWQEIEPELDAFLQETERELEPKIALTPNVQRYEQGYDGYGHIANQ
jgi:hypothetical protein